MAIVATGTAVSVSANSKSADQVTGTYQFLPFDAVVSVIARGSATGLKLQLFADGSAIMNDLDIAFTGTAGAISRQDHIIDQVVLPMGSRLEFFVRNPTAGSLTVDYMVVAESLE